MSATFPTPSAGPAYGDGMIDASTGPPRWLAGVAGVLTLLVGIAALVWPGPTLLAVGFLFGIYFVIWGAGLLVRGVGAPNVPTGLRILDVLLALLALLVGLFLMVRPGASVAAVAWTLGFWWALMGVLQVVHGLVERDGRVWNLVWGVVGVAAGSIILASPEIALGTLVLIVGIGLILQGLLELMLAFAPRDAVAA
jgi:uncharacterized membrane protein HdeD (DUF308 family)